MDKQRQLILSARLGDGNVKEGGSVQFSCIHSDYLEIKKIILEELGDQREVKLRDNSGYKSDGEIFTLSTLSSDLGKEVRDMPIDKVIEELNEFGLCLWGYDDGSLHHKNLFYNLNSHNLGYEVQQDVLIPKLKSFGIKGSKLFREAKKDGRVFHYVNIPKFKGAFEFDEILRLIDVPSYRYKLLPDDFRNVYSRLKREYSGLNIPQMVMSKVINGLLEDDNSLYNRLTNFNGILSYSAKAPRDTLVKTELVKL